MTSQTLSTPLAIEDAEPAATQVEPAPSSPLRASKPAFTQEEWEAAVAMQKQALAARRDALKNEVGRIFRHYQAANAIVETLLKADVPLARALEDFAGLSNELYRPDLAVALEGLAPNLMAAQPPSMLLLCQNLHHANLSFCHALENLLERQKEADHQEEQRRERARKFAAHEAAEAVRLERLRNGEIA